MKVMGSYENCKYLPMFSLPYVKYACCSLVAFVNIVIMAYYYYYYYYYQKSVKA